MRTTRYFAMAALAATLVLGATIETVSAQAARPLTKQELKKKLREQLKQKQNDADKAAKAAAAKAAATKAATKPIPAPVKQSPVVAKPTPKPFPAGPKDAPTVAKLIDQQIGAKLTGASFPTSPICTDAEFLRRAYLDITGVIPTADKAREFLDSTDANKRAKLIDELLASPNYGRHQADIWQAKLTVRESNNRFVLRDPFVKWIESEFNNNTPWNEFVTKIVTASGTVEDNPAVTYFLMNRSVDKITDSVTQHFLGVQLQCAQCHNHPFTGWKQTEYWAMSAFFNKVTPDRPQNGNKGGDNSKIGVKEGATKTRSKDFFPESAKDVPAKFLDGPEANLNGNAPYRPVLASWMTSTENPFFARAMVNRTWAQFFGQGFVNPVDDMHDDNEPSHPELLAALGQDFSRTGFDVKHLIRSICLSDTYQRSSKATGGNERDEELFSHQTVKVMLPEQLFDSLTLVTRPTTTAERPKKDAQPKGQGNGPRDQFVQFFLAGADVASTTEYEAGIPQALRLMNSKFSGSASAARSLVPSGTKPAAAIENIYLATLSRRPTTAESTRLTDYIAKSGNANPTEALGDILWAVLNSSEFTMVR